jgi:hypothetical protein
MQNNTEKSEIQNKVTKIMRDPTMLLLTCRSLREAVTFCAFEKLRESTTAEKRHREQQSVCDRKVVYAKTGSQIEKGTLISASHIRKKKLLR